MTEPRGKPEPALLVATANQSFGKSVVDAIESTEVAATAEHVKQATEELTQRKVDSFDGAVIDSRIPEPAALVERLTEQANLPTAVLCDPSDDGGTLTRVVEAGATDVFPRTTTNAQYELIIERLVTQNSPTDTRPQPEGKTTYRQAYQALFEKISEGLVVHDPETGEIVDVNERFCEMNGYERSELLGEPIGMVLTEEDAYGADAAEKMIQRARTEGSQQFEWRNKHRSGETVPVEVHLTVIELGDTERVLASVQDMTERKRREREYEQIFDGVNDIIAIHDPETGEMVDVNQPMCELTGYDEETALELGIDGLLVDHPEQDYAPSEAPLIIDQVMSGDEVDPYEQVLETCDGNHVWIEVNPTRAVIGGEERFVAISRDITERKRRQRELEQIFNGVNDGLTIYDPGTGAVLDANETYLDIFGYDDLETIQELGFDGLSVTEEGYTGERARTLISDVVSSGEPKTMEWQIETASGEQRWLESTVAPAVIGGEKRALAIQRDVTRRKRRQQEFEQIFNGVQDAIAVFDPDTVEILDVNEAYLEMFGHEDIEEVREQGISGLSISEDGYTKQRAREDHQRVAESGEPEMVEWQGETSDGERIWLEIKVAPVVIGGEQRSISVLRDVTERKHREQRLEVFNRILRHNLRNQLDVIRGHAEELADKISDDHAKRIITGVDELAETGQRARQVDRILSKDDAPTDVDIVTKLDETVDQLQPEGSNLSVTTEFPEELYLRADEETLTMAIESAVENALEHAESAVTVAVDDEADGCVITIADDGPGIEKENLIPIETGTETRLQHGRGLGLWQLQWCVDTLNGELSFEVCEGTTVRITVPN